MRLFIHVTAPLLFKMKELKSRMADMEGQPRPTAGISLLENKIQELEERVRSEERYALKICWLCFSKA